MADWKDLYGKLVALGGMSHNVSPRGGGNIQGQVVRAGDSGWDSLLPSLLKIGGSALIQDRLGDADAKRKGADAKTGYSALADALRGANQPGQTKLQQFGNTKSMEDMIKEWLINKGGI